MQRVRDGESELIGREVGVVKGNMSGSCGDRTVLYLECGGGYTNMNRAKHTHTNEHK